MRTIRVEKLTLNIGCGEAGEKLERAKKLLELLTGRKAVTTQTRSRTTFGTAKGRPIGVKVTLRGKAAGEFLRRTLAAVEGKLLDRCFDAQGNLSFGIKEHIDLPGVRYDPEIGIYGMDVCVTLERPGFRVKRKRLGRQLRKHRIGPGEAREFMIKTFGVVVEQ